MWSLVEKFQCETGAATRIETTAGPVPRQLPPYPLSATDPGDLLAGKSGQEITGERRLEFLLSHIESLNYKESM